MSYYSVYPLTLNLIIEPQTSSSRIMSELPTTLLLTIVALALVLLIAWVTLKFLSKFHRQTNSNKMISIQASMPIGNREKLMVVRCRDKEYFLATSPSGVSVIDTLALSEVDASDKETVS